MRAVVETTSGTFAVELEDETIEPWDDELPARETVATPLPRVLDADAFGSTVVAVVDAKPPLLVSHDAGTTWNESGRGLPALRAVAVAGDNPDFVAAAARNRLYLSRDGGRFWTALAVELPEIRALRLVDP
jgi:photosystem II stability/assembly factor-like uncharacterized protein